MSQIPSFLPERGRGRQLKLFMLMLSPCLPSPPRDIWRKLFSECETTDLKTFCCLPSGFLSEGAGSVLEIGLGLGGEGTGSRRRWLLSERAHCPYLGKRGSPGLEKEGLCQDWAQGEPFYSSRPAWKFGPYPRDHQA